MTTKNQHGVALVEFALILPLLLLLTFITTEFGRAMYQYNTLTKSVRDATRFLSIQLPNTRLDEARNLVVYGKTQLDGTEQPLALGLAISNVPDPTWQPAGADPIISTVTVRIENYTYTALFSSVFGIPFGSYTFPTISATMRSHVSP